MIVELSVVLLGNIALAFLLHGAFIWLVAAAAIGLAAGIALATCRLLWPRR